MIHCSARLIAFGSIRQVRTQILAGGADLSSSGLQTDWVDLLQSGDLARNASAGSEARRPFPGAVGGGPALFPQCQHADLAAYERDHRTINTDAAFLKMLGEAGDCFVAGSTHDEILQTI